MEMVETLIEAAWAVRRNAYAPYSQFLVGAALRVKSGVVFCGCNVENLSYGLTNCAERVAIGSMVAAGERGPEILVVVADTRECISPCGACRQVLAEFGDFRVVLVNSRGDRLETTESELLPRSSSGILDRS